MDFDEEIKAYEEEIEMYEANDYFDEDEYEFKKDTNFGKGYKISESGIDNIELYY